jgi:hypothetical protein
MCPESAPVRYGVPARPLARLLARSRATLIFRSASAFIVGYCRVRAIQGVGSLEAVIAVIVSAATSVIVALLSVQLASRQEKRSAERVERKTLNETYLNPLRFQIADNHYRIWDILRRPEVRRRTLVIDKPEDISSKEPGWFNGEGGHLASSVYLMACLFAYLKKLREQIPYLHLSGTDDTRLAELMLKLQIALTKENGIQYVVQTSLGEDMWVATDNRLRTYREFCQMLRDPESRVWLDRLINFFLETGQGQKADRALTAVNAMWELAAFLDECVRGGGAIESRWSADGVSLQLMKVHSENSADQDDKAKN